MAHTFRVTKTRKPKPVAKGGTKDAPQPLKALKGLKSTNNGHPKRLVVSAISKTPITVTPVAAAKAKKGQKAAEVVTPPVALDTNGTTGHTLTPARRPGRPRKDAQAPPAAAPEVVAPTPPVAPAAPAPAAAPAASRGRPRRIDHTRLLEEVAQVRTAQVPLAASRIVEQLESLLARGHVETFRGRKKAEQLILSKLEEQALQEALTLFQMKVTLQRGGSLRRAQAS